MMFIQLQGNQDCFFFFVIFFYTCGFFVTVFVNCLGEQHNAAAAELAAHPRICHPALHPKLLLWFWQTHPLKKNTKTNFKKTPHRSQQVTHNSHLCHTRNARPSAFTLQQLYYYQAIIQQLFLIYLLRCICSLRNTSDRSGGKEMTFFVCFYLQKK